MFRLESPVPVLLGVFLLYLLSQIHPTCGMSAALATAVEAELRAHVRNMELRAAEMHDRHAR